MLVQSTQSRKSWKSRSRLIEVDTVDFLFRRLIYTCTCTGKFRIYSARNSRLMPYQKVIEVYVQILLQFRQNARLPSYSLYFVCLGIEILLILFCLHSILILSLYLAYLFISFLYLFIRRTSLTFVVLPKWKIAVVITGINNVIHIIAYTYAIFSYLAVVKIPKRLVPIL